MQVNPSQVIITVSFAPCHLCFALWRPLSSADYPHGVPSSWSTHFLAPHPEQANHCSLLPLVRGVVLIGLAWVTCSSLYQEMGSVHRLSLGLGGAQRKTKRGVDVPREEGMNLAEQTKARAIYRVLMIL